MPARKHKLEPEPTPARIIQEVNEAEEHFRSKALVLGSYLRYQMDEGVYGRDDLSESETEFLEAENRVRKALSALSKLRKKQKTGKTS